MTVDVRPVREDERNWVATLLEERWSGTYMVIRGEVHDLSGAPALVALDGDERVGLVTYVIRGDECEITSLDSLTPGKGVGSALLQAVGDAARANGCTQLRAVTTNDNVDALRFYQKRGFVLYELHRDAVTRGRALKPSIPWLGCHGIPLRDELELTRGL